MNKIYQKINSSCGGKFGGLRFPEVRFFENRAEVTVLCAPADADFVTANKAELVALLDKACGFHVPVTVRVVPQLPTATSMRAAVVAFTEKFSYVSSVMHSVKAEVEPSLKVQMTMHEEMYKVATGDYIPKLKEFLENNFLQPVDVDIRVVEYSESGTEYAAEVPVDREYDIRDVKPLIGSFAPQKAKSVASIAGNAFNVAVCGVVAMPTAFTSKAGRKYDKFVLYDGNATLQCRFVPGGRDPIGPELIDKTVCAIGDVEFETAREEGTLTVRELSLCTADGLEPVARRPVPKEYERVIPKPVEEMVQSTFFDSDVALPDSLKGEYVVFDFETTGLSLLHDKPTELGAVKIKDGRITESFSTLIDPRRPIPTEVSEKTGITDEMVKGQPLFEDILPDFYKFTEGCGLVCHNIAFDFPILLKWGNRSGWAFAGHPTFDTMGMAPAAIPGIQRLNLDSVLESLGMVNDNAHRALSDATMTAKAFIAMKKRA